MWSFRAPWIRLFGDKKGESIRVFFDDFCVYSREDDHLKELRECLVRMDRAQLSLSALKCMFGVRQGIMLGYLISRQGIGCNPDKVEAISQRDIPEDVMGVRSFLAAVGCFRRTIESFTDMAAPLCALLKKGQEFIWTDQCTAAVQSIKQKLREAAVMKAPDWSEPFILSIRVVGFLIEANLYQHDDTVGLLRPVCSRKLKDYKILYNDVEKHTLVLVLGTTKLGHYLRQGIPGTLLLPWPTPRHEFPMSTWPYCQVGGIAVYVRLHHQEKELSMQQLEHGLTGCVEVGMSMGASQGDLAVLTDLIRQLEKKPTRTSSAPKGIWVRKDGEAMGTGEPCASRNLLFEEYLKPPRWVLMFDGATR